MTKSEPQFSIIIPTYNRENFLQLAIDSVRNQYFTDWECIVIDDGSTDHTRELIESIQKADERIKYFYQENKERSAARNHGIRESTGNYICFLDSDDTFDQHFLSELMFKIEATNADLLISSLEVNDVESTVVHEIEDDAFTLDYFFSNSIGTVRCCLNKSKLKEIHFDENVRISEDTLFLCDLMATNPTICIVPKAIYKSVIHDNNSVNYKRFNAYQERLKTLQLILTKPYAAQLDSNLVKDTLSNCFFGIFKFYYFNGRTLLARWTMIKSLLLYPRRKTKEKLNLILFAHSKNLF